MSNYDDDFRQELIKSGGMPVFGMISLDEEVSKMRFYYETMEEMIEKERSAEIRLHDKNTENLTTAQKENYWTWHYPVHWDDIFINTHRSSFIISLMSFTESQLNQICKNVHIIVRSPIKCSELRGNVFERSELFLNTFAGFKRPSRAEWKQIQSIYDVRNVLVHHDGFIDNYNRLNKLLVFIEEQSGLSESNGTIRLEKGFCVYCIDVIDNLMKTICEEVQNLCNNVKRFENPD